MAHRPSDGLFGAQTGEGARNPANFIDGKKPLLVTPLGL